MIPWRWVALFCGITLLFGLAAAVVGHEINDPEISRHGVALAVWGTPFFLLFRLTYGSLCRTLPVIFPPGDHSELASDTPNTTPAVRVYVLFALTWVALGVGTFWLWR